MFIQLLKLTHDKFNETLENGLVISKQSLTKEHVRDGLPIDQFSQSYIGIQFSSQEAFIFNNSNKFVIVSYMFLKNEVMLAKIHLSFLFSSSIYL